LGEAVTPEERANLDEARHGSPPRPTSGRPPTDDNPPSGGDPAWYTQVGRGLARGVASDVPGLSTSEFATQDDAGPIETASRYAGEYGPMLLPGLDLGLGAKFGTKAAEWALQHGPELQTLAKVVGPARAQQMIHGLWNTLPKLGSASAKGAVGGVMADPEHPVRGATTGALTGPAVAAIPRPARSFATKAAAAGAGLAGWEAAKDMIGGRGENLPAYFAARHSIAPLGGLAAAALLNRPTLSGAAGSAVRKWWEDDGDE
jgi:hypothetical protein